MLGLAGLLIVNMVVYWLLVRLHMLLLVLSQMLGVVDPSLFLTLHDF